MKEFTEVWYCSCLLYTSGKVEKLEEAADNAASSREDTEKIIFKYRKRRVKRQDLQAESAIVPDSDVSEEKS